MTVLTPPGRQSHQPELRSPPDEAEELEALIEEARRRARLRRAGYAAAVALSVLLAGGFYVLLRGGSGPRTASRAARSAPGLSEHHRTGVLTGLIRSAVIPSDPAYSGMPGLVIVSKPSGRVVARQALHGFGHHFRLVVPAGRYRMNVGSEAGEGCPAKDVVVQAAHTTQVGLGIQCFDY